MTDNEIIKALECCYSNYCNECPCFGDDDFCMFKMQQQAVDLINRQKANIEKLNKRIKGQKHALFEQQSYTAGLQVEIKNLQADKEALIAGQETLQKCIAEKMAEIERLTKLHYRKLDKIHNLKIDVEKAKTEAIKEFWEKAKQTREFRTCPYVYVVDGDNLVKEMTEGKNES